MKALVDPKQIDNTLVNLSIELSQIRRARAGMQNLKQFGAKFDTLTVRGIAVSETLDALDALHNAYGWTRYILVPDGHVHFNGCSTLRHDTTRTFLPDESGNTVPDMIAKYTTAMCTVCFPEAPVDPAYQEAERKTEEQKQAARDTKAAERQAKLDATPKGDDGEPLKVGLDTPKTERGARNAMIRRLKDVFWYQLAAEHHNETRSESHVKHDLETLTECRVIARSIGRMTGQTEETVYKTAYDKALADSKREYAKALKTRRP
jgi:hypothetical protein